MPQASACYALVHVVTDAVAIGVSGAGSTTHAEGVKLAAVAVAVAGRNVGAALVGLAGSVANAADVRAYARVTSSQMLSPSASAVQLRRPGHPAGCRCSRSRRPECWRSHS